MLGSAIFSRFANKHDVAAFDIDTLDITDFDAAASAVKKVKPHIIINAAAYTNVDGAEENLETTMKINALACRNLAYRAKENHAKLIHFSTDYVFDGNVREGYCEDDQEHLQPLNIYGKSKLKGERLIFSETENFAIVRISWLFGPNGKNFVDTMRRLAAHKEPLIRVVNDQSGKPTYTLDVADNLEQFFDDSLHGIFHLPNEEPTTWYNFAKEIFRLSGDNVTLEPIPASEYKRLAKIPSSSILINTKLRNLRPWKEALKDYIKN